MKQTTPLLEMRGITKRFGPLTAVDGVDLDVRAGEVHALLGENGAGKSTLMNCLFGLQQPDAGEIRIEGTPVRVDGPRAALRHGIGMVHQHFKLVPSLTVAENVFLGHERMRAFGFLDRAAQRARVAELSERYGIGVDPDAKVKDLSVGAQQRVEIIRALSEDVRLLVLDEPTAVLTPQETERLFETLRGFVAAGLGVVLISHHLSEVCRIADRVTVLRHGRRVAAERVADVDEHRLAELIVGKDLPRQTKEWGRGTPGAPKLEVHGLHVRDSRGVELIKGLDLTVHAGEIVGIAGVAGNGQTELVEAIAGIRRPGAGSIRVAGVEVAGRRPRAARVAGLAHVPEDRNTRGLSVWSPVTDNIVVGHLDDRSLGRPLLKPARVRRLAERLIERFDVRVAHPGVFAKRLSGGNAQKMVLARELSREPEVIVCCEPVRGLDIAATEFVHRQLVEHRDRGAAVLLVSTELPEILSLADRILVMFTGEVVGEFAGDRPSEFEVGRLMLGMSA
ncbi:ABC transporter ATP-binding protein [Microtetraspora fusca]|uniref:ABC transporter ATP-binding protein n=1 Tax=Microtetraspora fusca TaxID=1997 RepID=UPI00082A20B6|nr:ABC transporter ATP-binding protein [Microtetraspora fusca]